MYMYAAFVSSSVRSAGTVQGRRSAALFRQRVDDANRGTMGVVSKQLAVRVAVPFSIHGGSVVRWCILTLYHGMDHGGIVLLLHHSIIVLHVRILHVLPRS